MGEKDDVREAGRLIADAGLADDVRRGRTNRERAANGGADDADDRRSDERPARREKRRDDEQEDRTRSDEQSSRRRRRDDPVDDDQVDEDLEDDDDHDADRSNREDGDDGDDQPDDERADDDHEEDDDVDGEDRNHKEQLHRVKVNGETLEVPTSELIAGYSRNKDYHQKTAQLAETGRNLKVQHTKVAQMYNQRLQSVNAVMNGVRTMLAGEINGAEMRDLRAKDPSAWMVARQDYDDRIKQVDAVLNHLTQEHERHRSEYDTTQSQTTSANVSHEVERLLEFIPDWREGKNGKPSGAQRLAGYLRKSGFQDAEFVDVVDHRMLAIADKARRYDDLVARRSTEPQRKSKPVPKRVTTGKSGMSSGRSGDNARARNDFQKARDKVAKTGDMRDGGDAINALLRRNEKRSSRNRYR